MALGNDELRALDRLLDEALELGPQERDAWLERLAPEFASLAPVLRRLLTREALQATTNLIGRPPLAGFAANLFEVTTSAELVRGATIGPYRLLRELGSGGMGVVWLGERTDGLIDRPVALKLPLFSLHHRALAERFARERVILARLAHPNIARLYDAGIAASGQPYLALEYVEGEPLTAWCDSRHCSIDQRVELIAQVLRAVQYAHANLVIHRDLKPSNILVTASGDVRLLDFGIAKLASNDGEIEATELTRVAGRVLTPGYAAPELLTGAPISIASDVYSIGVILYELLTGTRPYRPRDDSNSALEAAVIHEEPLRPSLAASDAAAAARGVAGAGRLGRALAGDLDTITLKALKKRPEDRYPTAAALAEDLERHLRGEAIEARADSTLYRTGRALLRHRVAFSAAGVIALAVLAGASIAVWQAGEARREAARANAVQAFVFDLFATNSVDQPDPMRARQTTARELLDSGRARVAQSFADQPEVRVALLETLARLYSELGLYVEAGELGAQRIELVRSLYGADDLRVAVALSDQLLSIYFREDDRSGAADGLIREAVRIHDLNGDLTSLARARLHERASRCYIDRSLPLAIEHAGQAVTIYRAHHPGDHGFPSALAALANTRLRQGDPRGALDASEEALRVARSLHLPDHDLLRFLYRAGETSFFLDEGDRADTLLRDALAISERINGPGHSHTVAIRNTIARNLASMSRFDEAAEVAMHVLADATLGEGREKTLLRDTHRQMFEVWWGRGDLVAARDGNVAALASYGNIEPDHFVRADLLLERAVIQTAYGRTGEALATFAEVEAMARRLGFPRRSLLRGNLALQEAQTRLAAGDAKRARALLEEQATYWRQGESGLAAYRTELAAALVDALLALGENGQAGIVAAEAEAELAREARRDYLMEADAKVHRARARVLMAEGAWDRALPYLERSAALYARIHLPESPARAEVEALRAVCIARLGRRDEALSALALARTAEAKHGPLGEPLRTALREAESLLGAAPALGTRSRRGK